MYSLIESQCWNVFGQLYKVWLEGTPYVSSICKLPMNQASSALWKSKYGIRSLGVYPLHFHHICTSCYSCIAIHQFSCVYETTVHPGQYVCRPFAKLDAVLHRRTIRACFSFPNCWEWAFRAFFRALTFFLQYS